MINAFSLYEGKEEHTVMMSFVKEMGYDPGCILYLPGSRTGEYSKTNMHQGDEKIIQSGFGSVLKSFCVSDAKMEDADAVASATSSNCDEIASNIVRRRTYQEIMNAIPDVPYGILAKDGIIDYNGVIFVCDPKTNSINLGDCSVRSNCISVQLECGGFLNINRENIGQLAGCMDMFSAEDQERILRAIHQDQHLVRKNHEIDEIVNGIAGDDDG